MNCYLRILYFTTVEQTNFIHTDRHVARTQPEADQLHSHCFLMTICGEYFVYGASTFWISTTKKRIWHTTLRGHPSSSTEYTYRMIHCIKFVTRWLGSRVVSVLDSAAEGSGFRLKLQCCRVTVLGKPFTPIMPQRFTKQQNW